MYSCQQGHPLVTSIFFVKIKIKKIAKHIGLETRSAGPSQIFSLHVAQFPDVPVATILNF